MTTQTKSRGFTIVELLIVIVVIAILAAITIAAYTGITNRANTSAAQSAATSLAKKAEVFNTENGAYPATAGMITAAGTYGSVTTATSSTWYSAQGSAFSTTSGSFSDATTKPTNNKSVYYQANSTSGGCVWYYDFQNSVWKGIVVGTAPATNCTVVPTTAITAVAL